MIVLNWDEFGAWKLTPEIPSTWEVESGGPGVQKFLWPHTRMRKAELGGVEIMTGEPT